MSVTGLEGGFDNPAINSARTFRHVLNAMALPGRIETVDAAMPPAPLCQAAGAVLLTLADHETPIHLAGDANNQTIKDWLAFHTGAPIVKPEQAAFAVGRWADLMPLIVLHRDLTAEGVTLHGPGIEKTSQLSLPDAALLDFNAARFPLGIDMILTEGSQLAAVPRSTRRAERED